LASAGSSDGKFPDSLSPIQKQATQQQRLLGNVEEQLEKALDGIKDHERRLIKLENKGEI